MIGYAFCGSFCTVRRSINALKELIREGEEVLPIFSEAVYATDTRFGKANEIREEVEDICRHPVIHTVKDAEPIGPSLALDLLILSPCTGNTLAKLANGITDTSVTMATKAQLRSDRPVLIALATNDGMSANLGNIGRMLSRKQVYFVPMVQDDIVKKPHSLVADFGLLPSCAKDAKAGIQYRPLFLTR